MLPAGATAIYDAAKTRRKLRRVGVHSLRPKFATAGSASGAPVTFVGDVARSPLLQKLYGTNARRTPRTWKELVLGLYGSKDPYRKLRFQASFAPAMLVVRLQ